VRNQYFLLFPGKLMVQVGEWAYDLRQEWEPPRPVENKARPVCDTGRTHGISHSGQTRVEFPYKFPGGFILITIGLVKRRHVAWLPKPPLSYVTSLISKLHFNNVLQTLLGLPPTVSFSLLSYGRTTIFVFHPCPILKQHITQEALFCAPAYQNECYQAGCKLRLPCSKHPGSPPPPSGARN
jgi:hypothetical protein